MKKLWDWVKDVWVYSGLSKENYENIQQSVAHKNARLLKNAIRSFEVLTIKCVEEFFDSYFYRYDDDGNYSTCL